jgi:hypothetical protein
LSPLRVGSTAHVLDRVGSTFFGSKRDLNFLIRNCRIELVCALSPKTFKKNLGASAIRFFYRRPLHRNWKIGNTSAHPCVLCYKKKFYRSNNEVETGLSIIAIIEYYYDDDANSTNTYTNTNSTIFPLTSNKNETDSISNSTELDSTSTISFFDDNANLSTTTSPGFEWNLTSSDNSTQGQIGSQGNNSMLLRRKR